MTIRDPEFVVVPVKLQHQPMLCRQDKYGQIVLDALTAVPDGRTGEELCASAASMANNLGVRAIFVYTRRGYMASFLSRCRPDCPIFAFTGVLHSSAALGIVSLGLIFIFLALTLPFFWL